MEKNVMNIHDKSEGLSLRQRITANTRYLKRPKGKNVILFAALFLSISALLSMTFPTTWASVVVIEDQPQAAEETTICFTGDVMLGRYIKEYTDVYGYDVLYEDTAEVVRDSDITISGVGYTVSKIENDAELVNDFGSLLSLTDNGVDILAMASGKAKDAGETRLEKLLYNLNNEGVTYSGIAETSEDFENYVTISAGGKTYAFFSITDVYSDNETATESSAGVLSTAYGAYNELVYNASQETDGVIVYIYWGDEETMTVTDQQQKVAHQLISAGADIIVGSCPQTLQTVEEYNGGIIFYSLGSFIYDEVDSYSADSALLTLTLSEEGNYFTLYPTRINDGASCFVTNAFYRSRIISRLTKELDDYEITDDGTIRIDFGGDLL